jgi:ST7 protein
MEGLPPTMALQFQIRTPRLRNANDRRVLPTASAQRLCGNADPNRRDLDEVAVSPCGALRLRICPELVITAARDVMAKRKTSGSKASKAKSSTKESSTKKPDTTSSAIGGIEPIHPVELEGTPVSLFGAHRNGRTGKVQPRKTDALHDAQELVYQAFETRDPIRRVELAKQALAISADCADAYVLIAEVTRDLAEATELNRKAVEAGERALGAKAFVEDVGHFWGILETRPYMRARVALAQCLWAAGKHDAAIDHHKDLLRLNPDDNQGIRYILAACLLDVGRDDELAALIDQYKDDASAAWIYTTALLAFRRGGDSEDARLLLAEAKETNPHVPAFLLGQKKMPKHLPGMIGFGDESEAISYVGDYGSGWAKTNGAVAWLRSQ